LADFPFQVPSARVVRHSVLDEPAQWKTSLHCWTFVGNSGLEPLSLQWLSNTHFANY